MIVPMLKLSLLVFHEDYQRFLDRLREMGVVHINADKKRSASDELLQEKLRLAKHIDDIIRSVESRSSNEDDKVKSSASCSEKGEELLAMVESKFHRAEQATSEKLAYQKDMLLYAPWGEMPIERIALLKESGWNMGFYSVPERNFDESWCERYNAVKINSDKGNLYFVTLTPTEASELAGAGGASKAVAGAGASGAVAGVVAPEPSVASADEAGASEEVTEKALPESYLFPEKSPAELNAAIASIDKELEEIDTYLKTHTDSIVKGLKLYQQQIYGVTDMCKVHDATEAILDGKVQFFVGWIPVNKKEEIEKELANYSVSYEMEQPSPDEDVPIQLSNSRFARLFEPITRMFALPKYKELDPTPLFAPFFMLFFGLCLGDGGYGLLIAVVCALMLFKTGPSMHGYLKLGILLGCATVVVGILTGCFFGISLENLTWPWLQGVKQYFITDANFKDKLGGYSPLMVFAVVIGLVQIFFGMVVKAITFTKQFGIRYAWSTLGWVVGLITTAATFGLPLLGVNIPTPLLYILYGIIGVSAFAIVFLNSPGKNIFVNVGSSLWSTYNMATGLLGDTLSYIRLFALGLTGGILGGVFNTLAFDLTTSLPAWGRWLAVLLILLVGHAINFGLCLIGAFVHPMRLTFVEYYKNSAFEGGGSEYTPLKNRVAETSETK